MLASFIPLTPTLSRKERGSFYDNLLKRSYLISKMPQPIPRAAFNLSFRQGMQNPDCKESAKLAMPGTGYPPTISWI